MNSILNRIAVKQRAFQLTNQMDVKTEHWFLPGTEVPLKAWHEAKQDLRQMVIPRMHQVFSLVNSGESKAIIPDEERRKFFLIRCAGPWNTTRSYLRRSWLAFDKPKEGWWSTGRALINAT